MKSKTVILMVVAIGCGLAASYMTSQLLAERGNNAEEQQEKIKILVAKKNLELGLLIREPKEFFKEKLYLKGEEPGKALTEQDYDKLKGRRLIKPLTTDQFVTAEDLIDKDQNSLSARLPKGWRAVGVKVNIESIAGGFASLPMSRVDIVSVLRRGDTDSVAQTILEDVLVLAADMETQREGKNAMPANTVTVSLTPDDAELVLLAQEMGSLRLILRGFDDRDPTRSQGATGKMVMSGHRQRADHSAEARAREHKSATEAGKALLRKVLPIKEKTKRVETAKVEPVVKVEPPKPELPVKKEPKTHLHVLTIYNGPEGRRYPFTLDDKDRVIDPEITTQGDSEPAASQPRPPASKPQSPRGKKR